MIRSSILSFFCGLTQLLLITRQNILLGISDKLFIVTDNMIVITIAEINLIPILVYASRICPKNMEGKKILNRYHVCNYNVY